MGVSGRSSADDDVAGQGSDGDTRMDLLLGEACDAVAPAVGTRNCVVRMRIVGGEREEGEREEERRLSRAKRSERTESEKEAAMKIEERWKVM